MPALTPDAACETYAAIKAMSEWINRRFADYLRKRLPRRRDLLEIAVSVVEGPRTSQELVSGAVEYGFLAVLRRKVEMKALPSSGPAVSLDELYRCAGVIAAPFVVDLENAGALPPGAKARALKWRPQDLKLANGAFLAGLKQALETAGTPADLVEAIAPLVESVASQHACFSFPSAEGQAEAHIFDAWNHLAGLQAKYGCSTEELFARDEAVREFMRLTTNRADFSHAIDVDIFTAGEEGLDELQEAVQATVSALSGQESASAQADSAEIELQMSEVRSGGRAMRIAYSAFLHDEADLIWGQTSEPVA